MMAEKEKKVRIPSAVSADSLKAISESRGYTLSEDAAQYLADEVTYRLKMAVQEAKKFQLHGKRKRMNIDDFCYALKRKGYDPIYGVHSQDQAPFRHAAGGGREVYFTEEKEMDLQEFINTPLAKLPNEVSLKTHWLSIEGVQPAVPENPPSISKDLQMKEILDPSIKASVNKLGGKPAGVMMKGKTSMKVPEKVKLKEVTTHELSLEQQHYYVELTDACVGSDEIRRSEALTSLSTDPGLPPLVPRLCTFIMEGVRINVGQNNLALLIYLMRMTKALMENPSVYLEKCLHHLIPALASCTVSKQLCQRPDTDNHWALRDFAARQLSLLCRSYNTVTNGIQERITNIFSHHFLKSFNQLSTHYGTIVGLGELGPETVKLFVLPYVKLEADRLASTLDNSLGSSLGSLNATERNAAEHLKQALLKILPPVLKSVRASPDNLDDYKTDYGYLGPALHSAVMKLRQSPVTMPSSSLISLQKPIMQMTQQQLQPRPPSVVLHSSGSASSQPGIQQIRPMTSTRLPVIGLASPSSNVAASPRVMYVSQSRPNVPLFQSVSNPAQPQTAFIRVVSSGGSSVPGSPAIVGQQTPKLVMVSAPSAVAQQTTKPGPDLGMKSVFTSDGGPPSSASTSSQEPSNLQ